MRNMAIILIEEQLEFKCVDCGESLQKNFFVSKPKSDPTTYSLSCHACRVIFSYLKRWQLRQWKEAVFGLHCTYCRKIATGAWGHLDHIYPKKLGGSDKLGNRQLLCRPCNLTKSGRTEDEVIGLAHKIGGYLKPVRLLTQMSNP